jgi:hypothetical protein
MANLIPSLDELIIADNIFEDFIDVFMPFSASVLP